MGPCFDHHVARTTMALALAGLVTACSAGSPADPASAPSPTGDPDLWREAPGREPYPFVTPIPPLAQTPVDGVYRRDYPAGGDPIPCRRCAPYRLDSGESVLTLREGRFGVDHPASAFRSGGHYFVDGPRLILINDPNCPRTRGDQEIARLRQSRLPGLDHEPGPGHGLVVELPHIRPVGADRVHVRARGQEATIEHGTLAGRTGADHVSLGHGLGAGHGGLEPPVPPPGGQGLRGTPGAGDDAERADRPDRHHGVEVRGRRRPGPEDHQP